MHLVANAPKSIIDARGDFRMTTNYERASVMILIDGVAIVFSSFKTLSVYQQYYKISPKIYYNVPALTSFV